VEVSRLLRIRQLFRDVDNYFCCSGTSSEDDGANLSNGGEGKWATADYNVLYCKKLVTQ